MRMVRVNFILAIPLVAGIVFAQPHRQHHHHDTSTIVVYELDGNPISYEEVQAGIADGTLVWASGCSSVVSVAMPTTTVQDEHVVRSEDMSTNTLKNSPTSQSTATTMSTAEGLDSAFPDGEISCSNFPSVYGPISLEYLGLGGWSGIQLPHEETSDGYNDIETLIEGECEDGMYCSYACPPGYQKTQWPATQGADGQSIGGLKCNDGKLYLTNKDLSDCLCAKGTDKVTVQITNNMSNSAAVCRTDYPGTESETVPLDTQPGESYDLTCPDGDEYYMWQGSATSAQYYLNPAGVSAETACQWGDSSNDWGNFAPANLGIGYFAGKVWASIMQNHPTTDAELDYEVEIFGDNMVGKCKYSQGKYCSGDNYEDCNTLEGCTVAASSGTIEIVLS